MNVNNSEDNADTLLELNPHQYTEIFEYLYAMTKQCTIGRKAAWQRDHLNDALIHSRLVSTLGEIVSLSDDDRALNPTRAIDLCRDVLQKNGVFVLTPVS